MIKKTSFILQLCSQSPYVRCLYNKNTKFMNSLCIPELNFKRFLNQSKLPKKEEEINIKRIKKVKKLDIEKYALKVTALSNAESYDLVELKKRILNEGSYEIIDNDKIDSRNDVDREFLCLKAKYKSTVANKGDESRIIFLFEDGCCVFWNFNDDKEKNSLLNLLGDCSYKSYDSELIASEIEELTYSIDEVVNKTRLNKNHIYFSIDSIQQFDKILLEKYTFSDAISISIKLAIWENKLENFNETIQHISEDLKHGRKLKITNKQTSQKLGELYAMRHSINLDFNILNIPDYYWDKDELETLYINTIKFLDINKRTKVFNEKLNYGIDLLQMLRSDFKDHKHSHFEIIIILLISVEVIKLFI